MNTSIATVDIFIIAVYLIGIVAIGIFSTRKQKLNSENYFLAGRGSIGFILVLLFSPQIFQLFI